MDSTQKKVSVLTCRVRVRTISDVPEIYDISHAFEREAQHLSKEMRLYNRDFIYFP